MSNNRKENQKRNPLNGWKFAFLTLAAFLVGAIFLLGTRAFTTREEIPVSATYNKREGQQVFQVSLTKDELNTLISHYLAEFQKDSEIQYQFALENEAMISGEFKLLGFPMSFYLYLEPYVMENGNVQLKAKSLSIGSLGVPINEVLKMIARSFPLPDWVEVQPKEENIILRLDQFEVTDDLFVKMTKINLIEDELKMSVYLNEKTEKE